MVKNRFFKTITSGNYSARYEQEMQNFDVDAILSEVNAREKMVLEWFELPARIMDAYMEGLA